MDIVFTGIADPFVELAQKQLATRQSNSDRTKAKKWENCVVVDDYKKLIGLHGEKLVDIVFIGLPPKFHGSTSPGADVEIQCAKQGIHMFIEKPLR